MIIKGKAATFVAAAAGVLLFAGAAQATLLTNGGFEADDASGGDAFGASGWTTFANGFTTDGVNGPGALPNCCTAVPRTGTNSFKTFGVGGAFQSFAATAGDVFSGTAYGQNFGNDALNPNSSVLIQIAFFDDQGLPAGTAAGGNTAPGFNIFDSNLVTGNDAQDIWIELGVGTAPAPDNTAEVRFIVLTLANAGGAGWHDDASFDQVIPVPAAVWLFGSALGLLGWMRRKAV